MEKELILTDEQLAILCQCLHHHIKDVKRFYPPNRTEGYIQRLQDLLYTLTETLDEEEI